ncbi:MAG: hypothetical protein WC838_07805, partial [Candidatus Margulisiibacteriota bacterium]
MVVFAVPNQLTYSGRLLQNGALVNSTLTMTFKIFDTLTGVNLLWSTSNISVDVNQGIYSVVLDQVSSNVFAGDNAYLEVTIGSGGGAEVLTPRTRINSVGYALQAGGLSKQGGGSAVFVSANGNIGIGLSYPASKLQIDNSSQTWANANQLTISNGSHLTALNIGYAYVSGQYSGGKLQALDNSQPARLLLNPDGGSVGIGTTLPGCRLDISETNSILDGEHTTLVNRNVGGTAGVALGWYANGSTNTGGHIRSISSLPIFIGTFNNKQTLTIQDNGKVGIGTTAPGTKLAIDLGVILNNDTDHGVIVSANAVTNPGYVGQMFALNNTTQKATAFSRLARTTGTVFLGYELGVDSRDGIRFMTASGATPAEYMRINSSGYVGIGISNPLEKLDLLGTFRMNWAAAGAPFRLVPEGAGASDGSSNLHFKGWSGYPSGWSNNGGGEISYISLLSGSSPAAGNVNNPIVAIPTAKVGIGTTNPTE